MNYLCEETVAALGSKSGEVGKLFITAQKLGKKELFRSTYYVAYQKQTIIL